MGKEYIWPDGRSYKGEYYMDKKEGYGVFCLPDNFEYVRALYNYIFFNFILFFKLHLITFLWT